MARKLAFSERELTELTPLGARDLVVRCFFEAQRETFERAAQQLGAVPTDEDLRRTVEGAVRLAFRSAKADFEAPTKETLMEAVGALARKAAGMGTPPDIIDHHREQLGRVFAALPDLPPKTAT